MNIEEIKAREQAATPGPWKWEKDVLTAPAPGYVVIKPFFEDSPEKVTICILPNDMKFIAHARTDIPALIAEVERLTAENKQDEKLIKSYKESGLEQATESYELEKENATLKKALELAIAKIGTCGTCDQNCSFCALKEPEYFIQQAQQTHETQEAEK